MHKYLDNNTYSRGGSRFSRKWVHMYKGVGGSLCRLNLIFLKNPMSMKYICSPGGGGGLEREGGSEPPQLTLDPSQYSASVDWILCFVCLFCIFKAPLKQGGHKSDCTEYLCLCLYELHVSKR